MTLCGYRKGKCPVEDCGSCPKCGCECDRMKIEEKIQRKRGRKPSSSTSKAKVPRTSSESSSRQNPPRAERVNYEVEVESNIQISGIQRFRQVLGLDYGFGKHLPSIVYCENKDWDEFNPEENTYMTTAMKIGVEHLAGAIYGKDPKALINATTPTISSESDLISLIKDAVKKLLSQSTQRSSFLAILYQLSTMDSLNNKLEKGFICPRQFPLIGKRDFATAKKNYLRLKCGKDITRVKVCRQRFNEATVRNDLAEKESETTRNGS